MKHRSIGLMREILKQKSFLNFVVSFQVLALTLPLAISANEGDSTNPLPSRPSTTQPNQSAGNEPLPDLNSLVGPIEELAERELEKNSVISKGSEAAKGLSLNSTDAEAIASIKSLGNVQLDRKTADAFGILDSSLFELWENGAPVETYHLSKKFGELADQFFMVVGKNPADIKVELVPNAETGRTEAHIIFNKSGRFTSKYAGSRAIVGREFHDYVGMAEDKNLIVLLDRQGELQVIDRRMIRNQFGKSGFPNFTVERLKLDPQYDYQIAFKQGSLKDLGLDIANKSGGFRVDGTLIEDLRAHEELVIQDGGIFVYRKAKGADANSPVELVDFISRKSILTRATTQLLAMVGVIEDHQVLTKNAERGFQAALVDSGEYVDAYLKQHPEMFKAAELAEVRRTLATLNVNQLLDVRDSLEAQAGLDAESRSGRLIDWIVDADIVGDALSTSTVTKSSTKGFKETHGYKVLREYVRLAVQPATLVTLGLIAAVANADHLPAWSSAIFSKLSWIPFVDQFYASSSAILSKLFPMPLDDSYRPIQWRSMLEFTGFFYGVLATFGVIGWKMRKSIAITIQIVGLRTYAMLALASAVPYWGSKLAGQKNSVFAAKEGIIPSPWNGGLHTPYSDAAALKAREKLVDQVVVNRRSRALSKILGYAAVARKRGVSFSALNLLRIRLALAEKTRNASEAAKVASHESVVRALREGDLSDLYVESVGTQEAQVRSALAVRDSIVDLTNEVRLITTRMDQFNVDTRNLLRQNPDARLSIEDLEMGYLEANMILDRVENSSLASRWLSQGVIFLKDTPSIATSLTASFGLDLFRSSMFQAEPSEEVAQQNTSSSVSDIIGTQISLYWVWSGWPANVWAETAMNAKDGFPVLKEAPTPATHPEMYTMKNGHEVLTYNFLPSRADPRQPGDLAAMSGHFLSTNPQLTASLTEQMWIFWGAISARSFFEFGGASGVSNQYARASEKTPSHETYMTAFQTIGGWFKTVLKAREARYEPVLRQKLVNFFRFLGPAMLSGFFFRCMIGGSAPIDLPFQIFFGGMVSLWAYGWVWLPVSNGLVGLGRKTAARYSEFVAARAALDEKIRLLETAGDRSETVRTQELADARMAASALIDVYKKNDKRLESAIDSQTQSDKNPFGMDLATMKEVLAESNQKPAAYAKIHEGVQGFVNFLIGGLVSTALAIPVDVWMYQLSKGDKFLLALGGLGMYGVSIGAFAAARKFMERRGDIWLNRRRAAKEGAKEFATNLDAKSEQLARAVYDQEVRVTQGKPRFDLETALNRVRAEAQTSKGNGCRGLISKIATKLGIKSAPAVESVNPGDKFLGQF